MSRAGRALVLALALAGCEAEPDHRGPVIAGGDAAVQGAAVQDAAVQDAA
ncbi:MAG: hypothetical protein H6702_09540, partial [Myxococcales bacterium]|nr:hypothetical protein [Myxococcales bacterium]